MRDEQEIMLLNKYKGMLSLVVLFKRRPETHLMESFFPQQTAVFYSKKL